ncbi:MAG TPA: trypsin-like peptidase domain-containing protein [Thermodesulfobacteriota bacterium]|nr:trypsin-like peptidase domain-containing protein [Thermodesulfobacteriota bacterium]
MALLQQLSRDLEALVARAAPSVVSVEPGRGQASGLVLAPDGYVLTNAHVVRSPGELWIGTSDGGQARGRVVGLDARTDLAVVQAEARGLPPLPLAEERRVRVGQLVVAIGNPLRFERSVSLGVVSAVDRSLPAPGGHLLEALIQTDAAINPGNSGGPLLDADGAVVGINTAIVPFAQGIGFAVPAHTASWVAAVLIQEGEVRRPFLGIAARGVDLPGALARELAQPRAVRVFRVGAGTPAEAAGLREGDLLLSAEGRPLASVDDLQRVMVLGRAREIRIEAFRAGERRTLAVRPARDGRAA